jgi:hypothetical protein
MGRVPLLCRVAEEPRWKPHPLPSHPSDSSPPHSPPHPTSSASSPAPHQNPQRHCSSRLCPLRSRQHCKPGSHPQERHMPSVIVWGIPACQKGFHQLATLCTHLTRNLQFGLGKELLICHGLCLSCHLPVSCKRLAEPGWVGGGCFDPRNADIIDEHHPPPRACGQNLLLGPLPWA